MRLFDVLGPVMTGPSSSHTAGAVRIGLTARHLLGAAPKTAEILLHGSFAATRRGPATDRPLVAGLLGLLPDAERLPASFSLAQHAGTAYPLRPVGLRGPDPHPAPHRERRHQRRPERQVGHHHVDLGADPGEVDGQERQWRVG